MLDIQTCSPLAVKISRNNLDNYERFKQDVGSTRVARFFFTWYQNWGKDSELPLPKLPNGQEMYQMAVIYIPNNVPTISIPRPFKIYPNWDFWLKNKPSGKPGFDSSRRRNKSHRTQVSGYCIFEDFFLLLMECTICPFVHLSICSFVHLSICPRRLLIRKLSRVGSHPALLTPTSTGTGLPDGIFSNQKN
jgi:hypothetical protein